MTLNVLPFETMILPLFASGPSPVFSIVRVVFETPSPTVRMTPLLIANFSPDTVSSLVIVVSAVSGDVRALAYSAEQSRAAPANRVFVNFVIIVFFLCVIWSKAGDGIGILHGFVIVQYVVFEILYDFYFCNMLQPTKI